LIALCSSQGHHQWHNICIMTHQNSDAGKGQPSPFFKGCSAVAGVDIDMADMALAPNWPVHGLSIPPTQTDIKPITPAA